MIKIYGAHKIIGSMTTFIILYAPRFWGLFGPNSGSIIDSKTGFCPIIWERQNKIWEHEKKFESTLAHLMHVPHFFLVCSQTLTIFPKSCQNTHFVAVRKRSPSRFSDFEGTVSTNCLVLPHVHHAPNTFLVLSSFYCNITIVLGA